MALFFLAYFLPSFTHPFTINSLEVEIRYLLFIPIYLLVRELEKPHLWLSCGMAAGAACIFGYAMYELLVVGIEKQSYKIHGPYINHYYGSIAVVTAFVALGSMYGLEKRLQWVFIPAFCLGLISAILSGARGSYIMAFSAALLWGYLRFKIRIFIMFIGLMTIVSISLYGFSTTVKYQVDRAIDDVKYYFVLDDFSDIAHEKRSASIRLELWTHSLSIIRDYPMLGIGRGNFEDTVRDYMTEDQKKDPLLVHSHPHNAYLEVLVSKGLIGGLAFAMMFLYPMIIFFSDYRKSADTALPGIMLLSTFFVYSLSEVPFIKGNGTAVYLILLAVIFSHHMKKCRAPLNWKKS
ncbi:MAG: O-antigen ligase family protein [Gammaproteobacteria bacterium]|nr:O-antigen ligase family protein [Gammaproteobacteria bacterium]